MTALIRVGIPEPVALFLYFDSFPLQDGTQSPGEEHPARVSSDYDAGVPDLDRGDIHKHVPDRDMAERCGRRVHQRPRAPPPSTSGSRCLGPSRSGPGPRA